MTRYRCNVCRQGLFQLHKEGDSFSIKCNWCDNIIDVGIENLPEGMEEE